MTTSLKLAEIMNAAAIAYAKGQDVSFNQSVGKAFWKAFGKYEQSMLMQEVYIVLCDMGMTPLESEQ